MLHIRTVRNKIMITFLLLITLQIIAYGTLSYWFDSRAFSGQLAKANALTVEQLTTTLEDQIHTLSNLSLQIAEQPDIVRALASPNGDAAADEEARRLLSSFNKSWPQIDNAYLYTLDRRQIRDVSYEVTLPEPKLKDYADQDTSIQYGTVIASDSSFPLATVSFMRLIRDQGGNPLGWVRLDQNLYQHKFLKELFSDERMFMVLQPTGRVIYTNRPSSVDIVMISRLLRQEESEGSFFAEVKGDRSLLSYKQSGETDWISVLIMPNHSLNSALLESRLFTVTFIVLNIGLAFAGSLYLSRRVTRPLNMLHQSLKKIGMGDFTTRVPVISQDEIGYLGERINDMVARIETLVNQVYRAELDEQRARHQALRAQINPHFLYNTLESVDALVLKGDKMNAHQVLESLSRMLRYALKGKSLVTLSHELQHIEDYLRIQHIKYRNRLDIRILVPEEHKRVPMPPLVLQPLLENTFKHGFFRKDGLNRLLVMSTADKANNRLLIHVVDNGCGAKPQNMRPDSAGEEDSIGLNNVRQRIAMQFGEAYGLKVSSEPGRWFKVTVSIPLDWSDVTT